MFVITELVAANYSSIFQWVRYLLVYFNFKFDDGTDLVGDVVDAPGEVVGVEEAMHGTRAERRPPRNHSQRTRNGDSCPLNYS